MMDVTAYDRLTEPQRLTLRLYHQHLQIKEIARTLGISESTVNQRLTHCRKVMRAPTSRTAAKWFARYEEDNDLYNKSAYQFSAMGEPAVLPPDRGVNAMGPKDGEQDENNAIVEHPAILDGDQARKTVPWPFETRTMPSNRLGRWTRIALVVAVSAVLMITLMIVALLGIGFQDAFVSLQYYFVRP